jgi:gas vesicle structural protein
MRHGGLQRTASTVDVLDRVLDKGIVIETTIDISVAGIRLIGVDARILVASIEAYLMYADAVAATAQSAPSTRKAVAWPQRPVTRGRANPSRRARVRTMVCAQRCTFRRPFAGPPRTSDTLTCPYRPAIVCVLRPAD